MKIGTPKALGGRGWSRIAFKFARIASTRSLRQPCGMHAPLVRLSAIIIFALLAASRAEPASKPEEKAKLVTRVYRIPPSLFYMASKGCIKTEKPKNAYKKLPPTTDGETRYDVWSFFQESGVKKTPGAEAIYLEDSYVLVLIGSPEAHEFVGRLFEYSDCSQYLQLVEITANLWEYEEDQFADASPGLRRFADIRKHAGDSLKLIDSQLIVTRSGQRAVAVSKQADAVRPPVAAAEPKSDKTTRDENESRIKLNGARGSYFETEPTIAPDGVSVDMQFGYEARLKRTGATQDTEINVTTNVTVMSNHDAIPYCALVQEDVPPVKAGRVHRRALVISVRLIGVEGLTREEYEKQLAQKEDLLIRKARAGLGVPKK